MCNCDECVVFPLSFYIGFLNSSRLFPYRLSFPIILQGLCTLFGMHQVGKTPVLFCSLHNSNCVRLLDLPSWVHKNFYQFHHQIDKPLAQLPSSSAFAWLPSFRFGGLLLRAAALHRVNDWHAGCCRLLAFFTEFFYLRHEFKFGRQFELNVFPAWQQFVRSHARRLPQNSLIFWTVQFNLLSSNPRRTDGGRFSSEMFILLLV